MSAAGLPRRLSDIEASFAYTHALMRGTSQVTTLLSLRGDLPAGALERAVSRWVQDVPVLRLRIEERRDGLWFREEPNLQPAQLGYGLLGPSHTPDDVFRQELNDILPTGGPLWRLRAVSEPSFGATEGQGAPGRTHLYFTRNHAISDGHSTGALLRALLDQLDGPAPRTPAGVSAHPRPYEDVRRVPPNADGLDYRAPGAATGSPVPEEIRPLPALPFASVAPWAERTADFVPLALCPEQSAALRAWCRAHEVTVNQFLGAAFARAYAEVAGRPEVRLLTAVSLRGRYPGPAALPDVGCFINVVGVPVALDTNGPATAARRYGAALRDADARWRPPRRDHSAIRRAVEVAAAGTDAPGVCITNVGVVDPALGTHAARVTEFRTVVNRTGANYGLVLHVATFAGSMSLSVAYGVPATDPAVASAVAAALYDRVLRPTAEDPNPFPVPVRAARESARRTRAAAAG
ncbi:hypothetical protein [Streptomyces sp. NPDC091259]|uniref:phthiocerol/phthiodiolone dimycocerosyl transferase family protein n=1 Tax=Streptomyces sp. NPDC091259 TaxID=3365976 RepID=UPI003821D564